MIIGLTGGFAAGKSSITHYLKERGYAVFDADEEVHHLLATPGPVREAVAKAFPGAAPNGVPERAKLAKAVFSDPQALKSLEAILHPAVRDALEAAVAKAREDGSPLVCEVPLLVEGNLQGLFDQVWTVEANTDTRRQRASRLPQADFDARESRLAREAARAAIATRVIRNDGDLGTLQAKVDILLAL